MIDNILDLFGLDIFTIILDFIKSIISFFSTLFSVVFRFIGYMYAFNPVVAALFIIGCSFALFFGILKIIKLIPFL